MKKIIDMSILEIIEKFENESELKGSPVNRLNFREWLERKLKKEYK